jgi:hypothetical protein
LHASSTAGSTAAAGAALTGTSTRTALAAASTRTGLRATATAAASSCTTVFAARASVAGVVIVAASHERRARERAYENISPSQTLLHD